MARVQDISCHILLLLTNSEPARVELVPKVKPIDMDFIIMRET